MNDFLPKCFYHRRNYTQAEIFQSLHTFINSKTDATIINRLFYLAIPPKMFSSAADLINQHTRTMAKHARCILCR